MIRFSSCAIVFAYLNSTYTLRSAPCFSNDLLSQYDSAIYDCLLKLLNINFNSNALAWKQATLPASFGGLGIRWASDLALPAFLSSIVGSDTLVKQLLPSRLRDVAGKVNNKKLILKFI